MAKKKETKKQQEDKPIVFYTQEIKKSKTINEDTVKIISFIIILIVVLALLGLLFFLNGKYVTKDKYQTSTTTTTTEATYDDTKLTVNTMFGVSKDTYYVLAYDSTQELEGEYLYSAASSASLKDIKVYTLDLNNAMNKNYYNKDKEANKKPTKASDVNFNTNTLIVFKKGKVAEYITKYEDILAKLKEQNKTSNK